jgi:hypothetical protein
MAEEEPPTMACENCKNIDDLRSATKVNNRALRIVNRNLRRREEALIAQRDATVEALLETPNEAEVALREIWEKTGMVFVGISSDDYEAIVKAVVALNTARPAVTRRNKF